MSGKNPDSYKPWRDYLENILIAVFLALLVRTFVLTGYKVPTGSMVPTLKPGDFVFAYKIPFGMRVPLIRTKIGGGQPRRGDIVVFTYPDQPRTSYVKRVVGIPGDVIEIQNGQLSVNHSPCVYEDQGTAQIDDLPNFGESKVLKEKATEGERFILASKDGKKTSFGPMVVPPKEVFLMGDNRDTSDDSRYWGTVPLDRIEGKVVLIWMSLNWQRTGGETDLISKLPMIRWDRVFTSPL